MQTPSTDPTETSDNLSVPSGGKRRSANSGANVRLVLGLLLAGLIVLFTLQNAEVVELRLLFWTWSMPRAVMIFGVLATGILLGWILASWIHHKRGQRSRDP